MIEYAITKGEGTLLAYGIADGATIREDGEIIAIFTWSEGLEYFQDATLIAGPCTDDCETGK
jgi:hypothetical protein